MTTKESSKFQPLQAPKGIPEYLPPNSAAFLQIRDTFTHQARLCGYQHIELPVFEDTTLYARGVGESTDVVSKEMYTFADRGERSVTLRPEGTAGVMRAVIEHGLDRGALPVKLVYSGPFFRYERPQAGRYRQLQQVGVEAIGSDDPLLDAETIALADRCYRAVGLRGYRLELSSLGDSTCRPAYRQLLLDFLLGLPLDEETRQRAHLNPLRVLDDKRPQVREMTAEAPLLLDHLSPSAQEHFETLTGTLEDLGVPFEINPRLVRGLDYYTKTCFEFVHDGLGAQSGIGGGGRYDGLMAQLGGQELSGIGFGLGVDRTLLALEAEGVATTGQPRVDVFALPLDAPAKAQLMPLLAQLRAQGIACDMEFGARSLKKAMKSAERSGAQVALVLGETEREGRQIAIKHLASRTQELVPFEAAPARIAELLAGSTSAAATLVDRSGENA